MNRTLRDFATLCGGSFTGEDHAYTGVGTDTRALRDGEIYLALRGPRFDGNDFIDAAAAAGAIAAVVDRPVARASLPLISVADGQAALTAAAQRLAAAFRRRGGGRRRQQRQDHGQGNDLVDPRTARRVPGHAWQPEQPHRRAADAAAPVGRASQRRDRDRRQPSRRSGRPRAHCAPGCGPDHQCGRRAPGRLRRPGWRGARRGRDGGRTRCRRHCHHQRRRCLCRTCGAA